MSHRRFLLIRYVDVSGVSGTGEVVEGVLFSDGSVASRWRSTTPCTAVWDSLDHLLSVHGHSGLTEVQWIDPDPEPQPQSDQEPAVHSSCVPAGC